MTDSTVIKQLTEDNEIENFLTAPRLLILMAPSCSPCNQIAPILDELAEKYQNRVSFAKVNIEESELARDMMVNFNIIGVPAVMLLGNDKGGVIVGAKTKEEYQKALEEIMEESDEPEESK